ncbi:alpha/beta fold hydrolase [Aeromicrobium halocynthiae]|uniref:Alpha/beta fold hydrolase n=1 Tax=Aeromicrobium halocynthiae TaxID=560557 RepID=A0ABN2W7E8_9ACTN
MKRTIATIGTALVAAALTATVSASPAAAGDDAFYQPPSQLPSANGAIVRTAPQRLSVTFALQAIKGTGTRLMYKSTDAAGNPVAVTGTYIEPTAPWTGTGPRPLVAFASGTQGQGDRCAPSRTLSRAIDVRPGELATGYEIPQIAGLVRAGFGVVVTDYVGLGTPDRVHTYIVRKDLGHALLDAARAARNLEGTTLTSRSPIGLYGYSQGGGASGAAAELAPTYAPELNLKGAYVGAPPADPLEVLRGVDGTALTGAVAYAINGLAEYSPAVRTLVATRTNAAGKAALDVVRDQCVVDTALTFPFTRTRSWTTTGTSAADVVAADPVVRAVVDEQRLGRVRPAVPVMVLTGTQDDVVDHRQAKQLARDWCRLGAAVDYVPIVQLVDSGGTLLNHLTPAVVDAPRARGWLRDRLMDRAVRSNCSLVPILP